MEVSKQKQRSVAFKSPRHVQVWFLLRSRNGWKRKYKALRVVAKRLSNRVADVSKSRENWRRRDEQSRQRIRELEAENEQLRAMALQKKLSVERAC